MAAGPASSDTHQKEPSGFRTATQRADRRWHRALVIGMMTAIAAHLVVLLLFRTTRFLPSPFSAAGPPAGDVRAAAGGGDGGITMIEVREQRAPAPAEETPVPVPTPVPEPVVMVEPERTPAPETNRPPAPVPTPAPGTGNAGTGGAQGPATGPGTATGTGSGGGGTAEQGEGQPGLIPPTPRGLFIPPSNPPRSARGKEITVWVFVTEQGRVASDSVRLDPPTPDARYNRRLRSSAAEWVFEPARRNGRPVGTWFPFWITL